MIGAVRAFSNPNYDYYRLTKDLGNSDLFEKVERMPTVLMETLDVGNYKMEVHSDGSWDIHKYGNVIE